MPRILEPETGTKRYGLLLAMWLTGRPVSVIRKDGTHAGTVTVDRRTYTGLRFDSEGERPC